MKKLLMAVGLFCTGAVVYAQKTENIIIITTDGFRWQEVFGGMDKEIANDKSFNQGDSLKIFNKYWADDVTERRKKLLPFLWTTVAEKGQIYGNRLLNNKMDVFNPYWFSYPGYSEIMCGYADTAVNKNSYRANPNTTLLDFFNKQEALKDKIAAFGSWEAFNRILNKERSGFPVVAAYDHFGGKNPSEREKLINSMLDNAHRAWPEECLDVFTHYGAMEYLKTKKPKLLYISYGETDEWAHGRQYSYYLNAARQVDAFIKEIWDFVQSDPQYKNKTTLLFTTDHGRGDKTKSKWTSHGQSVEDAHEIWMAIMGPDTPASGEMNADVQLYQRQFAQTLAKLMGYTYTAEHPVADEIKTAIR